MNERGSSHMNFEEKAPGRKGQARGSDNHKGNTAQSNESHTGKSGDTAQSRDGATGKQKDEAVQSKEGQIGKRNGGTAQSRDGMSEKQKGETAQSQDSQRNGHTERSGRNGQANERSRESGNTGSTSGSDTKLTSEQRTQVRQHFSSSVKSKSITNVNFSVSVGAIVPRSVHVYEVPADIVKIVPAYRGYKYVVVRDEILILEPDTLKIVVIIDV
jgi:hypothetical protein